LALRGGGKATLYALDWPTDATRTAALEFLSTHATGDVVLPDHLRPTEILVRPSLSDALKAQWSPDMTLVEGDIIIPVDMRTDEVQISTGGLSTRRFTAKVECHQFELAFVSTVHKSQGSTLKKIIISLLNRPFPPRRNDWHAIYVALTRVRSGDDLRVLADAADLNFLDHLRPPADLLQFIAGYDENGIWSRARVDAYVPGTPQHVATAPGNSVSAPHSSAPAATAPPAPHKHQPTHHAAKSDPHAAASGTEKSHHKNKMTSSEKHTNQPNPKKSKLSKS
jgi:hypothetical protein